MVAESGEGEQGIWSETTGLEIDEKRFVLICDQDIVGPKITVRKSEGMELVNDIKDAKKEFFVDRLVAPQ